MAGFFGLFDFTKEGPGVYPDDPPRGPFGTFFAVLGRKFWKIVTINLMYLLFSIPALLVTFFGASFVVAAFFPNLTPELLAELFEKSGILLQEGISFLDFANVQILQLYILVAMLLLGTHLIIVGPVHAGVVYVLRNYSREEHAFVWSDFKEHALANWKQSLITALLSFAATVLFIVNYAFYNNNLIFGSNLLRILLQTLVTIMFVLWCMMQLYLYPMMVTFDLKVSQLLRNCLMFSILRLPLNLLILLVSFLVLFVIPGFLLLLGYGISILAAAVWFLFLSVGFNIFLTTFFSYRALDKHMISRILAEEEQEESELAEDEAAEEEGDEESEKETGQDEPEPGFVPSPY